MEQRSGDKPSAKETIPAVLQGEVERVKRLREDVLLLRFHLVRRTDLAKIIDPGDRLSSEAALKSSLEILENVEQNRMPPVGHIAAACASLLDSIDRLVTAARMAQEQDGTGEEPFPVTPESLRACLSELDIAYALGVPPPTDKKRQTANEAKTFLFGKFIWTVVWFFVAVCVHAAIVLLLQQGKGVLVEKVLGLSLSPEEAGILKNILIPLSAFFWALVGSFVWILIRFRRFGAAYAFDPAHAEVFKARVLSGSITTAVLLYFVFGGAKPWAENWTVDLPLWGFILGYAGKLQVELLGKMVDRVQGAISGVVGGQAKGGQSGGADRGAASEEKARSASASVNAARDPETKDPGIGNGDDSAGTKKPDGRG